LRAAESKHSFHLFFHRSLFHTIPKRCFKQADDIVRLRDLLKRSLGAKANCFVNDVPNKSLDASGGGVFRN
jgi:hypothetical protein